MQVLQPPLTTTMLPSASILPMGTPQLRLSPFPIVDDTLVEGNETVNLSLTNPTGTSRVTLGTQSTATLNIVDNDIAGTLQFSAPTFSVNEDGTAIAAVTVTRTGGSAGAASATVNLTEGTATAAVDYDGTPIVVNFADGESAKTVTFPIGNDTLVEGDETVNLSLVSPTGNASIGTPNNTATLLIVDNDPQPTLIANLSAASIVGDSITGFSLASAIDSNKVSNVWQDGIPFTQLLSAFTTAISYSFFCWLEENRDV